MPAIPPLHAASSTPSVDGSKKQSEPSFFLRFLNRIKQALCCMPASSIKHNNGDSLQRKLPPLHAEVIRNPALFEKLVSHAKSNPDGAMRSGASLLLSRLNQGELKHDTKKSSDSLATQGGRNKVQITGESLVSQLIEMITSNERSIVGVTPEKITYLSEMESLENGVTNFDGPHFDTKYYQLCEMGTTMELHLDSFELNDPRYKDAKDKRKEILVHIGALTKALQGKGHEDGKHCGKGCR
jgi:hypothetical protein